MKYSYYYWWIVPYNYLEKAYRAAKRIQKIKKNHLLYKKNMLFSSKQSQQSIPFYTNTELNNSIFIIYLSLLEYKISSYLVKIFYVLRFMILDKLTAFFKYKLSKSKSYKKTFKTYLIFTDFMGKKLIRKMNRKLAWIEATLNDLYIWKHYYLFPSLSSFYIKKILNIVSY